MSKVSIIMGVYNARNTIDFAINSVLNQSFTDWELIICDDCSTDDTYDYILNKYNQKNIILLKNKKNSKLAFSLNRCLEVASGEYIARMDADDICMNNRLEKQVKFLDSHSDIDVVGSAAYLDNGIDKKKIRYCEEHPTKESIVKGTPFMHPTIMMRKAMYDKLNGYTVLPRTVRGQDLDLWFRFFSLGGKGYNLQEPLLIYHESSNDYKKRTLKTALMYSKTMLYGFKILELPYYKYIYALKPLISAILPNKVMQSYHSRRKKV